MLTLYNYLSRKKEAFRSLKKGRVGLYTCGPTVYNFAHIGNLRTYIFEDVLRRTLELENFRVQHVMNITDVGHLTSDRDTGEDKMEAGAKREGKSVWDIAKFFTRSFLADIKKLNISKAHVLSPATSEIPAQIKIIKQLFKKGFAYETSSAVYFHVPKFKKYSALSRQPLAKQRKGVRNEVIVDPEKKHPADFVLWFKLVGRYKHHVMQWPSPWGRGFPGWHIECSAISSKYLGQPFDIHTGGIDHVTVHHTNEIAQSQGAYGKPLANYWLEGEHMVVDGKRMAKSLGNFYLLSDLAKKGFGPLDFRYFTLGAHYRTPLNFIWKALEAARNARVKIAEAATKLIAHRGTSSLKNENEVLKVIAHAEKEFRAALEDDLNAPKALAVLNEILHYANSLMAKGWLSTRSAHMILALIKEFDRVLGLDFSKRRRAEIPAQVKKLVAEREALRAQKRWQDADQAREKIKALGYIVEDDPASPRTKKI